MVDRLKRDLPAGKIDILTPIICESTRNRYRDGRPSWGDFFYGAGLPHRLDSANGDRGEMALGFLTWEYRISGVGYSGILTRYAAIRFAHFVEWCDLSKASFRIRSF